MTDILLQVFNKIAIIVILSLSLQGLKTAGLIDIMLQPLQKIKTIKGSLIFWFLFSALVSSIAVDLTAAAIICPLIIFYCNNRNIQQNRELFILSGVLGVATGGDLTKYGGGDNLILVSLFESRFGYELTNLMWWKYLLVPTLLLMFITILLLLKQLKEEELTLKTALQLNEKPNVVAILFIIAAIICVFSDCLTISVICLICGLLATKVSAEILKTIPYKAIIIWSCAFLAGKLVGLVFNKFIDFSALNISENYILFIFALGALILTAFCTQTLLTSCFMDIIFIIFGANMPAISLMIKCINSNYTTILSNGCFPVGQGYGVHTNTLFKIGAMLLIPQAIIPIIWYFILI